MNRYLTENDGELAFNALVVGVPEKAAYLTENLHLRAFVVCGGVTYYSAVKTDSVYGAVKRVSADPNYENDPYIQRISSFAKQQTVNTEKRNAHEKICFT